MMMKKNKVAIIIGGSGYIGTNLTNRLIEEKIFHKIYIFDIKPICKEINNSSVLYSHIDIRNSIDVKIENIDVDHSWIFNFAAVHREPGHSFHEYFDTNIPGARNCVQFAKNIGIKNIFFTSSIAPYGRAKTQRTEQSEIYPETAYGISKSLAEQIHKNWLYQNSSRRLVIVRPSVIFGPNDPGNVYRMIKSLKEGLFVLPNGGNIIKAYGYIHGLLDSILFTMAKRESFILYNYAENPTLPLKKMVKITKNCLNIKKPTFIINIKIIFLLATFYYFLKKIIGGETDIHPVRVRKLVFSTNIKPKYLIDNKFEFKYDYEKALKHWIKISPEEF